MGKLEGRVAVVTGASRGIGKAVAIGFAREGAKVAVVARTTEQFKSGLPGTITETVDEIRRFGGSALPVRTNVLNEEDVQAMMRQVLDQWGTVDILVNNSAVNIPGSFADMTAKSWGLIMGVNLTGLFLCTKAVIPTMVKQKRGSIIHTSSPVADPRLQAVAANIAYGASKAATEYLTIRLAGELGAHNIAVNCYKPARAVATEGYLFNLPPGHDRSHMVGPESMVRAAIFLAQQDANGVTACVATDEEIIRWHGLGE